MKQSELRAIIRRAELTATLLRQPGFVTLGRTERERIAGDLATLAQIARRAFNVETMDITPLYGQTAEPDATEEDLFGGAA